MRRIKLISMLTALFILVLVSGCGSQNDRQSKSDQTGSKPVPGSETNLTPASSPPVVPMTDVAVYYVKITENDSYLVREVHRIKKTPAIARAAVNELIQGKPVTPGAERILPTTTEVRGIKIDQGVATVDFSPEVLKANVGSSGELLGILSIVNTLTEFPAIDKVSFTVEGSAEKAMNWWGHVGLSQQPFSRNLAVVKEPEIWVTAPASGQMISSPVEVRGSAQVFEAGVGLRLRDAEGNVMAKGLTTASEGAPGRGDFLGKLDFQTAEPGKGQLEVFATSPEDGSDLYKVVIPVKWK